MSNWSLKQWTEQLSSTDEAARHEAADMLGEQGDPRVVSDLVSVSGRVAGYWPVSYTHLTLPTSG